MSLPERCEREVHDLHDFFVDWLGGDCPDDDATFERVRSVLADEFEITGPDGETQDCDAILAGLREGHGARGDGFEIHTENVRPRFVVDGHCLVVYEEHQRIGGTETARLSTVLFRETDPDETPNGVEWIHLQETWLPGGAPDQ